MIEVKNIHKTFGDNHVLKDVSFTFNSGKTTLIKCMVGLHSPDSGSILFNESSYEVLDKKEKRNLRKEIGMLFQGGALFDYLTVEQNIAFPLSMFTNMSDEEKKDRVNFCLKRVNFNISNALLPS